MHSKALLFFLLYTGASICLMLIYFGIAIGHDTPSLFFKLCSAFADASLFTFICTLFRGRWRLLGVALSWCIGVLLLVNLLYSRNFYDLIPASQYGLSGLSDPTVTAAACNSFRAGDLVFLICPLLPTLYFAIRCRAIISAPKTGLRTIGSFAAVTFLFWSVTIAGTFRRQRIYNSTESWGATREYVFPKHTTDISFFYDNHNFTGYLIRILSTGHGVRHRLTSEQLDRAVSHISDRYSKGIVPDSVKIYPSNLILIVVESLPYRAVSLNDSTLAPTLSGLVKDSAVITLPCRVLTRYGRSSDAQFMYNTGLLPLRSEPLVATYSHNNYPSLSKALGKESLEVIGENPNLWSHAVTTRSYGFDRLISGVAVKKNNQDSIILAAAAREINAFSNPFYIFISTLSMHNPYVEVNTGSDAGSRSKVFTDSRDKEYLNRLNHFDTELGRFLSFLKQSGKFSESLIVIAGDHEIAPGDVSPNLHDTCVPLIIINSPVTTPMVTSATQADVFPSILDMMGVKYPFLGASYSGLGKSIFDKAFRPDISEEDYDVAELLIRAKLPDADSAR